MRNRTTDDPVPFWPQRSQRHLHIGYGLSVVVLVLFGLSYAAVSWHGMQRLTDTRLSILGELAAHGAATGVAANRTALQSLSDRLARTRQWTNPARTSHLLADFRSRHPGITALGLEAMAPAGTPPTAAGAAVGSEFIAADIRWNPANRAWQLPFTVTARTTTGVALFRLTGSLAPLDAPYRHTNLSILLRRAPLAGLTIAVVPTADSAPTPGPAPADSVLNGIAPGSRPATAAPIPTGTTPPGLAADRVLVLTPVPDLPIAIAVSAPLASVRDFWWQQNRVIFGLLLLAIAGSAGSYRWILTRERSANARELAAAEELAHQSFHDALTGLLNRRGILDLVTREHALSGRAGRRYTLLQVDIDHFKIINDAYGHAVGDQVLVRTAEIISKAVRTGDSVGRYGGEEFMCLLPDTDSDSAMVVAERIRHGIEADAGRLPQDTHKVTASIGVAAYPQDSSMLDELLGRLDSALYEAKHDGRNRIAFASQRPGIFFIGHQIQAALSSDDIFPAYQPIVDLKTGETVAEEALARLRCRDGRILPALHFIEVGHTLHLEHYIDQTILEKVIARCTRSRQENGAKPLHFVNISGSLLQRPDAFKQLLAKVKTTCNDADYGPRLVIEITERDFLEDQQHAIHVLQPLIDMGVRLALDDFGSGYSSFLYLSSLPISYLKIDMELVQRATHESRTLRMVKSLQEMSQDLDLITIAEGIEDAETAARMRQIGIDWGQGYHFAPPLPGLQLEPLES